MADFLGDWDRLSIHPPLAGIESLSHQRLATREKQVALGRVGGARGVSEESCPLLRIECSDIDAGLLPLLGTDSVKEMPPIRQEKRPGFGKLLYGVFTAGEGLRFPARRR